MRRIFLCPQAIANLLSINQFCKDNDCFFILTGSHFFIKDNQTCDDPFFFFFFLKKKLKLKMEKKKIEKTKK
jgi:hypothetical protein